MLSRETYFELQRELVIKAIEELSFEEVLRPERTAAGFELRTTEGTSYSFRGRIGAWGNLLIDRRSFKKVHHGEEVRPFTMASFFREIQHQCEMSDETLVRFLEEGNQTLFGDALKKAAVSERSLRELATEKFQVLDQLLLGHPKLIMNRGRIGWGQSDLLAFAPERAPRFQLRWLAVHRDCCLWGLAPSRELEQIYLDALGPNELGPIRNVLPFEDYKLLCVHPWQWDQYVAVQFQEELVCGKLIDLGCLGKEYTPQASLRTLSPVTPGKYDLKLSLSILNTSCVRGIPTKYIETGHAVSEALEEIIAADPELGARVSVLKEVHAVKVRHAHFDGLAASPYRYKELLGCVWRENVETKLSPGELALPTGALLFKSGDESLVAELMATSGLAPAAWVESYFRAVVLPLYHLQLEHGLGLVSHGQNTILVHRQGVPERLIVKDFHGDLRIASTSKHAARTEFQVLDRLPPQHLIHDLFTGHFISVLRYLSSLLCEANLLDEGSFYRILGRVIRGYHGGRSDVPADVHLLRRELERVLVNKVRFVAGYGEAPVRLKPMLGETLRNPLLQTEVHP